MAKLATRPLVTSTNTHRRKRRASSLGRSSNDRAAPLTQPLLRASCPVSNTRLLSLHRRYADLFPPCYAVAMWMRRMNGSCRRAWTGLPTILPPATNQHPISLWCIRESRQVVALATSGPLGALRPSRAGPIERRAAPPAPTLALCGRSRAGLERGRRAVSCIIRWLLNLLAGGLGAFLAGMFSPSQAVCYSM